MMMSVTEVVICPEFAQTIEVIRNAGGGWGDDGRPTIGTNNTIQVYGTVLPATEKEVANLQLGELPNEVIKILTPELIQSTTNETEADKLIWKGGQYKVEKVKNMSDFGFYRAFAVYEGDAT